MMMLDYKEVGEVKNLGKSDYVLSFYKIMFKNTSKRKRNLIRYNFLAKVNHTK